MIVEVDGVTHQDGVTLTREQFYASLPSYAGLPQDGCRPRPNGFADAYRAAHAAGADGVVSVHIARTVSGVCNAAELAASDVANEGIPVRVVDSGLDDDGAGPTWSSRPPKWRNKGQRWTRSSRRWKR
ncbi:MAG: hypothetical protein KatS3mg052_0521 [Candidatus Roseilinea sp.]|nr:MAG: hypothetical protein KatS3mg052_0521 [Candidatus Roseilinea sp.]